MKTLRILSTFLILFLTTTVLSFSVQKKQLESDIATIVDSVQIQRKWHGLSLDNYSLGIILSAFLDKRDDILIRNIVVSKEGSNTYQKQYNHLDRIEGKFPSTQISFSNEERAIKILFLQDLKSFLQILTICFLSSLLMMLFSYVFFTWIKRRKIHALSEQKALLAKKVAHDIQAPIAALSSIIDNSGISNSEKLDVFKGSIQRIKDIVSDLNQTRPNTPHPINLNDLLCQLADEFSLRNLKIELSLPDETLHCLAEEKEIARHLANLLTNAFEASKNQSVLLSISEKNEIIQIKIQDCGCGIPKKILNKIRKGELVSYGKESGQGIGLYYSKRYFESIDGTFSIESTINEGTVISITLPIASSSANEIYIHLEDDVFVRKAWRLEAKSKNKNLLSFDSFEKLQHDLERLSKDAVFYIDRHLNNGEDGLSIAGEIYKKGFRRIFLSSADQSIDLSQHPYLSGYNDKTSPWA